MAKNSQPSIGALKQALAIAERIQELEGQLSALLNQAGTGTSAAAAEVRRGPGRPPGGGRKKPKFSAAARAAISAAQRARWAKIKKAKGTSSAAPKAKKARKKPKFSAAAREAIASAQRARWAKIRKEKAAQ